MASALQCPACGYKHRLSGLSGEPLFPCAHCGRLLKTPTEFRRPEPSGPAEAPRPTSGSGSARLQRGGSARRDQTSVLPGPPGGAPRAPATRRPPRRQTANLARPLRILAWVAAIFLSALIVRWFAKLTGLVTGDSVIDVITGSGFTRYLRLFALVPVWALFASLLATLFIEGGRWWMLRRRGVGRPVQASRPVQKMKVPAATTATTTAKARAPEPDGAPAVRKMPKRAPEPVAEPVAEPDPEPEPEPTPAPAPAPARQPTPRPVVPNPAASETRSPTGAAGAPRPRRIPRRDVSS